MVIDMYKVHAAEQRAAANAIYISAPEFEALQSQAAARGYRHASLSEINASAKRTTFAPDLFCWRGGLWIAA